MIEDEIIETKVAVNMRSQEPAFKKSNFSVISHNGVVLLVGQVESDFLRAQATEIASQASAKIKRIHNELEVAGKTGFLSRSNDAWIATKIKRSLSPKAMCLPASQSDSRKWRSLFDGPGQPA